MHTLKPVPLTVPLLHHLQPIPVRPIKAIVSKASMCARVLCVAGIRWPLLAAQLVCHQKLALASERPLDVAGYVPQTRAPATPPRRLATRRLSSTPRLQLRLALQAPPSAAASEPAGVHGASDAIRYNTLRSSLPAIRTCADRSVMPKSSKGTYPGNRFAVFTFSDAASTL